MFTSVGLILIDRPINDSFIQKFGRDQSLKVSLQTRLIKGGPQDISPKPASCDSLGPQSAFSSASPLEILLSCWEADPPWRKSSTDGTILELAYHPLRMVAADWMIYLEVVFLNIKLFEYSSRIVPAALERIAVLHADISTLQAWLRRCMSTTQKIRYVLRTLRCHAPKDTKESDCAALIEDYEEISSLVETYNHRLETTISVATSLIQAFDCRRSLEQTENISRLTYLALGFIPLTFVAGLFSMNEQVAPGGKYFWLYFAVAIPLCIATFLVIQLPSMVIKAALAKDRLSQQRPKSMA